MLRKRLSDTVLEYIVVRSGDSSFVIQVSTHETNAKKVPRIDVHCRRKYPNISSGLIE